MREERCAPITLPRPGGVTPVLRGGLPGKENPQEMDCCSALQPTCADVTKELKSSAGKFGSSGTAHWEEDSTC